MPEQDKAGGFWRKLRRRFRRPRRFVIEDFYEAGFALAMETPVQSADGVPLAVEGVLRNGIAAHGAYIQALSDVRRVTVPPAKESAAAYCNGFRDGLERRASSVQ